MGLAGYVYCFDIVLTTSETSFIHLKKVHRVYLVSLSWESGKLHNTQYVIFITVVNPSFQSRKLYQFIDNILHCLHLQLCTNHEFQLTN